MNPQRFAFSSVLGIVSAGATGVLGDLYGAKCLANLALILVALCALSLSVTCAIILPFSSPRK